MASVKTLRSNAALADRRKHNYGQGGLCTEVVQDFAKGEKVACGRLSPPACSASRMFTSASSAASPGCPSSSSIECTASRWRAGRPLESRLVVETLQCSRGWLLAYPPAKTAQHVGMDLVVHTRKSVFGVKFKS